MPRWRELVVDGLGMAVGSGPEPDGLYLRVDERRSRLIVLPGDTDTALAVGWEVRDQFALQRVREQVEKSGVAVDVLSEEESRYRDAEQVIAFDDPSGTPGGGVLRAGTRPQSGRHPARRPLRHRCAGAGPRRPADAGVRGGLHVLHRGAGLPARAARSGSDRPTPRDRPAVCGSWVSISAITASRCALRRTAANPGWCT